MKRLTVTIIIITMVLAVACKNSSEIPKSEGSGSNSGTTQSATPSTQSSTASPLTVSNPSPAATPTTPGPAVASGMNPPHGEPGHRCDIGVGFPLNSPPGTGKTQQSADMQTKITTQPITPSTSPETAPGMNPPHGQPNHRCDIAVGVPLDSPPGTGKQPMPNTMGTAPSTSAPPIKIVPAPK